MASPPLKQKTSRHGIVIIDIVIITPSIIVTFNSQFFSYDAPPSWAAIMGWNGGHVPHL